MITKDIRHMATKVRIYRNNPKQTWVCEVGTTPSGYPIIKCIQSEYEYREYNLNDELVGWGTEDFSADRLKTDMVSGYVYGWNGTKRNKGGYRWWTCLGFYRVRKSDIKNLVELITTSHSNSNEQFIMGQFRKV